MWKLSAILASIATLGAPCVAHQAAVRQAAADAPTSQCGNVVPEKITKAGFLTVDGTRIPFRAVAGILEVQLPPEGKPAGQQRGALAACMSFVYYRKAGIPAAKRPITFLFNGGPGSSTMWLLMGAFGPKRLVIPGDRHGPGAPYPIVDNAESLLDASDLVFVDAPGTGFGQISGSGAAETFYGVDGDGQGLRAFHLEVSR